MRPTRFDAYSELLSPKEHLILHHRGTTELQVLRSCGQKADAVPLALGKSKPSL